MKRAWRWTWNWLTHHTATAVFVLFCLVVVGGFGLTWWTVGQLHHQQAIACQRSADARIVNRNLWFGLLAQFPDSPQIQSIHAYVDNALPTIKC